MSHTPHTPPSDQPHPEWMSRAIQDATENIKTGGGPFAALIIDPVDGVVVGRGANRVVPSHDPTAHAEVMAIRNACEVRQTHVLTGLHLYSSCEPCPMCLGAIYWARLSFVAFACTRHDAAEAGFDDEHLYVELAKSIHDRELPMQQLMRDYGLTVFHDWTHTEDRVPY